MSKIRSGLAILALSFSFPLFALDQEDICRNEIFIACEAKAKAKLVECNMRQLESDAVVCEPISVAHVQCDQEAKQAACGGTVKPPESESGSFMPKGLDEDQSSATTVSIRPSRGTASQPRTQQSTLGNPASSPAPSMATATPQDSGGARSEASADIAQCTQIQSEAQRCCGNPLSCASPAQAQKAAQIQQQIKNGPSPGQSIPNYCAQLGQLSSDSGSYNQDMAGLCYGPQSSCSRTCQSLAQKYYSRASNCSDATCSIFQNAAEQLSSMAGNCDMLSSQVSQWSSQGMATASPQAGSSLCSNTNYSAQSSADKPNQKSNPLNSQSAALGANNPCLTNPGSAQCQAAVSKPDASGGSGGTGGYASVVQETGESGFNPENMHDMSNLNASMNLGTDAGGATTGGAAPVVANNSGGGIPGGGGGGGGGAKMDPKKGGAPAAANSNIADIMQGNRSGGGYSQDAAKKNSNDNQFGTVGYRASSTGGKRGPASVTGAAGGGYLGMDLKKYLPGGERQPYRGIAGFNISAEINGKSADLFKKVSTKIEEKCRLGILWECR